MPCRSVQPNRRRRRRNGSEKATDAGRRVGVTTGRTPVTSDCGHHGTEPFLFTPKKKNSAGRGRSPQKTCVWGRKQILCSTCRRTEPLSRGPGDQQGHTAVVESLLEGEERGILNADEQRPWSSALALQWSKLKPGAPTKVNVFYYLHRPQRPERTTDQVVRRLVLPSIDVKIKNLY